MWIKRAKISTVEYIGVSELFDRLPEVFDAWNNQDHPYTFGDSYMTLVLKDAFIAELEEMQQEEDSEMYDKIDLALGRLEELPDGVLVNVEE